MPKTAGKLEDFGQKIGGARKDLWAIRGLLSSDLPDMTDYEKKEYINKNNIWKKPDYEAMLAEGRPREVIYFIKLVRDALPPKFAPSHYMNDKTDDEQYGFYIDFVQEIKNKVMNIQTVDEIKALHDYLEKTGKIEHSGFMRYKVADDYYYLITNKLVNVMSLYASNISRYLREIRKKQFLYSDYEKATLKYTVLRLDNEITRINRQELPNLDLTKLKNEKYTTIFSVQCESDRVTDGKSRIGIYVKPEIAEEILKDAKAGEYLCFISNRYIGKAEQEKAAYDKCYEHYKAHLSEKAHEKKQSNRKPNYIPPQLQHVDRNGPVWRPHNRSVDGNKMLEDFKFRGGEFGNWLNESDRKQSLNFCYDALMDLSYALGMQPSGISFNGALAIAFGARGRGGAKSAVAHYEPARQVINLTKMKGAGSLGHEWIHAMDHAVASICGNSMMDLATKSTYSVKKEIPKEFFDIMTTIRSCTNYIKAAEDLDKSYGSDSQGYWASDCELLARAGACWLHDRLSAVGIKNDYLVGHAEGKRIAPHGEERVRIDLAFNKWLEKAKEIGFFNQEYMLPGRNEDMNISVDLTPEVEDNNRIYDPTVEYVQVSLFDLPELSEPKLTEKEKEVDDVEI